ncbi:formimidoyltransferase-cyclodeaminase-like [Rhopilema esculentum]|uniref:formimidoyltransferase-cyclodeaminase-like n=1 Tax=Rhopilema esculentum TaxID=499914 RepID=UPI0031D97702
MAKIIECVPNFSEGIDQAVIDAISHAIQATDGCSLLDVDPGTSTNRTVYTFVGPPEAVVTGAINGAKAAAGLIDMRRHQGEHPRLGALDVCPFIPVANATMDDCIECANMFGKRASEELGIPVYLYGFAAKSDYRRAVPQIRAGEYEGLAEKIKKDEWKPDYGPAEFIPSWGATIAGARKYLIAYNINVLGTKEQAHRIALNLRENGRGPDKPGKLKKVQGLGWYLQEANLAQISLNLLDFEETAIHTAFEEAKKDLEEINIGICGSEVVGLVPLKSILMAADYYMGKENLFIMDEKQKVRLVIERLGLSSIKPFIPEQRIIEFMVGTEKSSPLASSSLRQFIYALGSRSSAPGGGSAAAAIAAMGSALGLMVGWMSYGNRKFEHLDATMRQLIPPLQKTMLELVPMIDADTNAFNEYMAALKMSHKTPEETERREAAMQGGLKTAISVPLKVMQTANQCWETMVKMAEVGNIATISDIQVGAKGLETGVFGAYCNVMINLKEIKDESYLCTVKTEAESGLKLAKSKLDEVLKVCEERQSAGK